MNFIRLCLIRMSVYGSSIRYSERTAQELEVAMHKADSPLPALQNADTYFANIVHPLARSYHRYGGAKPPFSVVQAKINLNSNLRASSSPMEDKSLISWMTTGT